MTSVCSSWLVPIMGRVMDFCPPLDLYLFLFISLEAEGGREGGGGGERAKNP